MSVTENSTATLMRVVGWGLIPTLLILLVAYPHGFTWGIETGSQYHPNKIIGV